jgi:hypothetical protein
MSTWNRLDLQTLGSQPIMPRNLPEHCFGRKEQKEYLSVVSYKYIYSMRASLYMAWGKAEHRPDSCSLSPQSGPTL